MFHNLLKAHKSPPQTRKYSIQYFFFLPIQLQSEIQYLIDCLLFVKYLVLWQIWFAGGCVTFTSRATHFSLGNKITSRHQLDQGQIRLFVRPTVASVLWKSASAGFRQITTWGVCMCVLFLCVFSLLFREEIDSSLSVASWIFLIAERRCYSASALLAANSKTCSAICMINLYLKAS